MASRSCTSWHLKSAMLCKPSIQRNLLSIDLLPFQKKLLDSINNFHMTAEEISLLVSKDTLKLKSYSDDGKGPVKVLQTELNLDPADFEEFDIRAETSVTFCLKEFKAILGFCDSSGQPVTVSFEKSGRPLVLSVKYFGVFEADFVMATLVESSALQSNGSASSTSHSSKSGTPSTSSNRDVQGSSQNIRRSDTKTASFSSSTVSNNNDAAAIPSSSTSVTSSIGASVFQGGSARELLASGMNANGKHKLDESTQVLSSPKKFKVAPNSNTQGSSRLQDFPIPPKENWGDENVILDEDV